MRRKALGVREIRPFIEEIVEQKIIEIFGDPDSGLELKDDVKKRLMQMLKKRKRKGIPIEKVAKEIGLEW